MNYSAKENMTTTLVTTHWSDTAESAYIKMKKHKIRHLPVVNHLGTIVGIVSDRDLHKAILPDKRDYASFQTPTVDFNPKVKVQELMSWPVRTIEESSTVREIAMGMITEKISAYLVTKDEVVTGIITHEDLLRVLVFILEGLHSGVAIPGTQLRYSASLNTIMDTLRAS